MSRPGSTLPFIQLRGVLQGKQRCCYLTPEGDLAEVRVDPAHFNSIIWKGDIEAHTPDNPQVLLVSCREVTAGEEVLIPALHPTGPDGWPYNFAARINGSIGTDRESRNSYCRYAA